MKRKTKTASNFPVRLSAAERPVLLGIADRLGLTYKNRPSVGQVLHYLAAGEALILLNAFDTSAEMRAGAWHLRALLKTMNQDDYDVLEQPISALAAALYAAADIRAEFEHAESDEL